MSSHPDFHSYFETDALVRLELHCQTLLPSKFFAEKIFNLHLKNGQIFTKSLRETIDRYNLELTTLFA